MKIGKDILSNDFTYISETYFQFFHKDNILQGYN